MGQSHRAKALLNLLDQGISHTSQLWQRSHTVSHTCTQMCAHTYIDRHRPGIDHRIRLKNFISNAEMKGNKTQLTAVKYLPPYFID